MPAPIKKLSERFLKDPKQVEVSRPATANASIDQRLVRVDGRKKTDALVRLLGREEVATAIIFCNRKTTVRDIQTILKRSGFKAGPIHGDMEQPERLKELDRFKTGEINILVASDVAARGLDIKGVSHVFNFDVPWQPDDYIHRIGRTGRAGATGIAITLAGKEDSEKLQAIEKMIGAPIPALDAAVVEPREEAPSAAEEKPEKRERKPRNRAPKAEASAPEAPAREERERRPRNRAPKDEAPAPEAPAGEEREAQRERPEPPRRPQREDPRPRRASREPELEGADEDWNGPIPGFLAQGFGS
jgi:superfamily II DNA/RNA helicase